MKRRFPRGFSLLELLSVISLLGVVLAIASTLLGSAMRLQSRANDRANFQRTVAQFSQRFRSDAHGAVSVDEKKDGLQSIVLTCKGKRVVVYVAHPNSIERRVESDGTVKHREQFLLPESKSQFSIREDGGAASPGPMVTVDIRSSRPHPVTAPTTVMPIEAVVGLHEARMNDAPGAPK
jgi:prepilin-type N-terminal cleavage/methylation domain-containing protein